MHVDVVATEALNLPAARDVAATLEAQGYDCLWVPETRTDPFIALALAASATDHIGLGTAVAIAFARSPMTLAMSARNVHDLSGGRLRLGLGSQVQQHITRRYSMTWSRPLARMDEFVRAVRAIWTAWDTGERLNFVGEFYQHTLMSPYFAPDPSPYAPPQIVLGAVNAGMAEVAGRVADGLYLHSFVTPGYLGDVLLPAVEAGQANAAERPRTAPFEISLPVFLATGRNAAELADAIQATRKQIAFYASTPAYRAVLEHRGWEDIQPEAQQRSREGRWDAMADLITDEILDQFALVGAPASIASQAHTRFGGMADRISFYLPYEHDLELDRLVHQSFLDNESVDG